VAAQTLEGRQSRGTGGDEGDWTAYAPRGRVRHRTGRQGESAQRTRGAARGGLHQRGEQSARVDRQPRLRQVLLGLE